MLRARVERVHLELDPVLRRRKRVGDFDSVEAPLMPACNPSQWFMAAGWCAGQLLIVWQPALQEVLDHAPEERPFNCAVGRSWHDSKLRARNGPIETRLLAETGQLVSIASDNQHGIGDGSELILVVVGGFSHRAKSCFSRRSRSFGPPSPGIRPRVSYCSRRTRPGLRRRRIHLAWRSPTDGLSAESRVTTARRAAEHEGSRDRWCRATSSAVRPPSEKPTMT